MFARFLNIIVFCFSAVFCIACDILSPPNRSLDISPYFPSNTTTQWEYKWKFSSNDGPRSSTLPQGYVWRRTYVTGYQRWSIKRIQSVTPDSTYCVLQSVVRDTTDNYTETLTSYAGWVPNQYTSYSYRTDTLVVGISSRILSISYKAISPFDFQIFDLSDKSDTILSGNGVLIKKIGLTNCFAGGRYESASFSLLSFKP